MSEVNLSFVVQTYDASFTVSTNELQFNPESTELGIYTGGYATAAGSSGQVQYNNSGILAGNSNFTYNISNSKLSVTQANTANLTTINLVSTTSNTTTFNVTGVSNLNTISNVHITGGTSGQYIKTDGLGNLSFSSIVAGGNTYEIQFNNANLFTGSANLTYNPTSHVLAFTGNLAVTGPANISGSTFIGGTLDVIGNTSFVGANIQLGTSSNLHIDGGSSGEILSTDGYGTLSWIPQAGGTGSGVPGGSTYSIQFNSGTGNFSGANSMSYTPSTGTIVVQQVAEPTTLNATGATGTINYDLITQSIYVKTANATANFTLNFRGNSTTTLDSILPIGKTMTCTFINVNGTTGYYANVIQVDSGTVTPKWFDATPPGAGSANSNDVYTFNILKTAAGTFTVFATAARYA